MLSVCVTVLVIALNLKDPQELPQGLQQAIDRALQKLKAENMVGPNIWNTTQSEDSSSETRPHQGNDTEVNRFYQETDAKIPREKKGVVNWKQVAKLVNLTFFWMFLSALVLMVIICLTLWHQANY